MPNEVVIDVVANTKQAESSLKRVGQGFKDATPQVSGFSAAFGGLTKGLAVFGIGSIGAGVALGAVTRAVSSAAKAQANLDLIVERLPSSLKAAYDDAEPQFGRLSDKYAVLEEDVALAMGLILEKTLSPTIGLEELEAALGLVAAKGISVSAAADTIAKGFFGDEAAIAEITAHFEGWGAGLERVAEAGAASVTEIDRLKVSFQNAAREAGGFINKILELNRVGSEKMPDLGFLFEGPTWPLGGGGGDNVPQGPGLAGISGLGGRNIGTSTREAQEVGKVTDAVLESMAKGDLPTYDSLTGMIRSATSPYTGRGTPGMFAGAMAHAADLAAVQRTGIGGFANGGIVRKPTIGLLGEKGPEAVIPLNRGMLGGVNIIIQGDAVIDDENRMGKLVKEIQRLLTQAERTGLGI